jgi:hypothetical protein
MRVRATAPAGEASPFPGIRIASGEFGTSCAEIERAEIGTTRAENDHHHFYLAAVLAWCRAVGTQPIYLERCWPCTDRSVAIFMMHRRENVLFCRTDSEELLEKK